ncbi:MFS transporter [uncultured Sphingomonas sp.]|uniref:MFS transporter n=1 Tax=uncultured Sphingomonas sp. TaxID=158754 RepID=UPI0035CA876E
MKRGAALAEWQANWPLVVAATIGMSITGVHLYSLGVLLAPIAAETGWSRTEITLGQTLSSAVNAVLAPLCGVLMDRYGPRRIAIPGTIVFCLGMVAFAAIGHSLFHWYATWGILSVGLIGLKPNVWTGAVSSAFSASRALAFALVISGVSLAGALVPSITNLLLDHYGWRGAYVGLGILWAAMLLPLCLLFPKALPRSPAAFAAADGIGVLPGLTVRAGLRSRAFAGLAIAGFVFSTALFAITFHFVPMLRDRGFNPAAAAAIAGLIGIFSIIGRLITGVLLDRYAGALVGGIALLLPIIPVTLLLMLTSDSLWLMTLLAILIGLSVGSELDILAYLATRYFGLRFYGTLFGCIIGVLAAATALGPVLGSMIRDQTGSYRLLLWLALPGFVISALAIATAGRYPEFNGPRSLPLDPA